MNLADKYVIAGTGSRSLCVMPYEHGQAVFNRLCIEIKEAQRQHDNLILMSGGAEGFDHWITMAARACSVPYVLCIPNKGYINYYWTRKSATGADQTQDAADMLAGATDIEYTMEDVLGMSGISYNGTHSNFIRNQRMTDLADEFFVYNATSSGTADCVRRINVANKPWKEIR